MAEFKLSLRAEAKLTDIYAFTEIRFGRYQADTRGLNRRSICWLILRALVLNHIFYTEESYGVLIRDLFHAAQDIRLTFSNELAVDYPLPIA